MRTLTGTDTIAGSRGCVPRLSAGVRSGSKVLSYQGLALGAAPPIPRRSPNHSARTRRNPRQPARSDGRSLILNNLLDQSALAADFRYAGNPLVTVVGCRRVSKRRYLSTSTDETEQVPTREDLSGLPLPSTPAGESWFRARRSSHPARCAQPTCRPWFRRGPGQAIQGL